VSCSFCGELEDREAGRRMVRGRLGTAICSECVEMPRGPVEMAEARGAYSISMYDDD